MDRRAIFTAVKFCHSLLERIRLSLDDRAGTFVYQLQTRTFKLK